VLRDLYRKDPQRRGAAISVIAQSGSRGCKFIRGQLSDSAPFEQDYRKDVLDALARARDSVQSKSNCSSADLLLALRYYDLRDFARASIYFERVSEQDLTQPLWLYYRGVAYAQTQTRDSAAAFSLHEFENHAPSEVAKAAAWTYLGAIHDHSGKRAAAINDYEKALQLAPQAGPVRSQALNNLAYMYAEHGERLDLALDLVNQSLANDTTAARLDTKSWVLFRLGRCMQADTLSQRLVNQYPNPVYRAHADSIRNALGNRQQCH
jgi:tetratricopeptide (TPR) repeat protein